MGIRKIDLTLCNGCGICVNSCPQDVLRMNKKTKKPFGVNIPLVRPDSQDMIDAAIQNGVSVVATSSGSPKKFTKMIQGQGCRVIHVVSNVAFAKKCEDAGVDAIAAEGYEAGGHNGHDEVTTMALIPQVVDAVRIPVIAAGGIADGRGLVAALALGAKGVQMGTRFLASHEASAHQNYKAAIVKMADIDTCVTGRTTVGPTRAIHNKLTEMILKAEKEGAKPEELFEMIGEGRSAMACIEGDCEQGTLYCGQIGGAVKEIKSARQIIDDMITEAKAIIESLNPLILK